MARKKRKDRPAKEPEAVLMVWPHDGPPVMPPGHEEFTTITLLMGGPGAYVRDLDHLGRIINAGMARETQFRTGLGNRNQQRRQEARADRERYLTAAAQIIKRRPRLTGTRQVRALTKEVLKELGLPETKFKTIQRALSKK